MFADLTDDLCTANDIIAREISVLQVMDVDTKRLARFLMLAPFSSSPYKKLQLSLQYFFSNVLVLLCSHQPENWLEYRRPNVPKLGGVLSGARRQAAQ
jgi:hypothetical protein